MQLLAMHADAGAPVIEALGRLGSMRIVTGDIRDPDVVDQLLDGSEANQ